jgi:hypothetical protein
MTLRGTPCIQSALTVGTSAVTALAANPSRSILFIQNTHASNNLFIDVSGVTATAAAIKLTPNQVFSPNNIVPTNAVSVVGSAAGTTYVAVEG